MKRDSDKALAGYILSAEIKLNGARREIRANHPSHTSVRLSIQVDDFPVSIGDNMGLAVLDAPGGRIRDLVYVWRDPLSVGVQIGKYSDQGEQEKTSAEKLHGSVRPQCEMLRPLLGEVFTLLDSGRKKARKPKTRMDITWISF